MTHLQDTTELPTSYAEHLTVNFKKDKKLARAVQVVFALVVLLTVGIALLSRVPPATGWAPVVTITVTLTACLVYMAVHEATHGVILQLLTKTKPTYKVRFPFLITGNHAYLPRRSAVLVALSPALVWGTVLLVALFTLPDDYRLTTYVVLALNFAGSGGDFVEAYVVSRQRPDSLFQDDGEDLRVYLPRE